MSLGKILVILFVISLILSSPSSPKTNQATGQIGTQSSSNTLGTTSNPNQVSSATPTHKEDQITVCRVIDGDTVELSTGQKLRYIGIDSPETNGGCFALEAKLANEQLVLNKAVRLEKDISETDRYSRLLRYVWVGETLVNDQMIRQGYAKSYAYPPDTKFQEQFRQAEAQAQSSNLGMWSACTTTTPTTSATPKSTSTTKPSSFVDKDCSDFKTQHEAQAFFIAEGGPTKDPHRLDGRDKDGIVCESLPP